MATDTVRSFVERLQRDVAGADPTAVIGVYDVDAERWIVQPDRDDSPEGFAGPGLVARVKGSDHVIEETGQAALLELANFVQDLVIDEIGRSWPDVPRGDGMVHLDPEAHGGGIYWATAGEIVCAIGDLPTAARPLNPFEHP